jgi:hypothetical protein
VIPERLPDEIIAAYVTGGEIPDPEAARKSMISHLDAYSKSGKEWGEYANKIDSRLRAQMKKAFKEIRKNGFQFAYVDHSGKEAQIVWYQVADHNYADNETNRRWSPIKAMLCNLCDNKECRVKSPQSMEDTKKMPCWSTNYSYMKKLKERGWLK